MAASEGRYTFPRSMRLRGSSAFDVVFAARMRKQAGPLVLHSRPNGLEHNRLGLAVPRKVGKAVRRNRIKRRLREAFRLGRHELPTGYDLVVLVRPHEPLNLEEYQQKLRELTERADRGWKKRRR